MSSFSDKIEQATAIKSLTSLISGKRLSTSDTSFMLNHLNYSKLDESQLKYAEEISSHHLANKKDSKYRETSRITKKKPSRWVEDSNGSSKWITVNGHHMLINSGEQNNDHISKQTKNDGIHNAEVSRRLKLTPEQLKDGKDSERSFSFSNDPDYYINLPTPDLDKHNKSLKRKEEDKQHNLFTVYDHNANDGEGGFRRVNLKHLHLLMKEDQSKTFI